MLQEDRCQWCLDRENPAPGILCWAQRLFEKGQCHIKVRDRNETNHLHTNPLGLDHGTHRLGRIQTLAKSRDHAGNLLIQTTWNLGKLDQVSRIIGKLLDTADGNNQHWLAGCVLGRCLEYWKKQRHGGTKDEKFLADNNHGVVLLAEHVVRCSLKTLEQM